MILVDANNAVELVAKSPTVVAISYIPTCGYEAGV